MLCYAKKQTPWAFGSRTGNGSKKGFKSCASNRAKHNDLKPAFGAEEHNRSLQNKESMDYVEKLPTVRRAEDTQGESIRVREQELEGLESHRSSTLDHKLGTKKRTAKCELTKYRETTTTTPMMG